jgi:Glycosyltransferase
MMKTILHVSKYYYPDLGGIETVAMYLAEGLKDYHNIVICFSKDKKYHEEDINGVKVYRVPVNYSFMSQDISFRYYGILKKLVSYYQPFAVHVHCPNPFVYPMVTHAISQETKLIAHWHSDILSKGIMYDLIKPFEKHFLDRADLVISTSPNYINYSKPLMEHIDKVKVAQNGLITSSFDLQPEDKERIQAIKQKYDNKKIVLFVGRHVPYKGIDYLIRSEQYIKSDCVILIAGTGPQTHTLQSIPRSNRVVFIGKLPDQDLRCYAHAATVFAFPSITKAEAFGIALAEAMYCKSTPVTFSIKGSGVNWVSIKDVTCEEVPLKDEKAFGEAIDKLLSDENLCQKYALAGYQRIIDNFTETKAIEIMANIYKNL